MPVNKNSDAHQQLPANEPNSVKDTCVKILNGRGNRNQEALLQKKWVALGRLPCQTNYSTQSQYKKVFEIPKYKHILNMPDSV